jgi:hypothetical protein
MSIRTKAVLALTTALALAAAFSVRAQRGDRRRNRFAIDSSTLASIKSLDCSFSAGTAGRWDNGTGAAQTSTQQDGGRVTIQRIDVQDGTAQIFSGFVRGQDVNVRLGGENLHFLDVGTDGGLGVITVFAAETRNGRLQAVYSRAAHPQAAQYYGDCAAGR